MKVNRVSLCPVLNTDYMFSADVHEAPLKRKKKMKPPQRSPEDPDVQDLEHGASARQDRNGVQGREKLERGQSAPRSAPEAESSEGVAPCHGEQKKRKRRGWEDAEKGQESEQESGEKCAEGAKEKRKKRVRGREQDGAEEHGSGAAESSRPESAEAEVTDESSQRPKKGSQQRGVSNQKRGGKKPVEATDESPQRQEKGSDPSGVSKQKTGKKKRVASDETADRKGETPVWGAGQQEGTEAKEGAAEKLESRRRSKSKCQLSLYEGWGAFFETRWQRFWRGPGQQRVSFLEKGSGAEKQSGRGQRRRKETVIKEEPSSLTRAEDRDSAAYEKVTFGQRAQSEEGEAGMHVTLGCSFIIRGPLPCSQQGCSGHARYAFRRERRRLVPEVCNAHKQPGMEVIRNHICEVQGCTTRAHYNFPGQKTRIRCGPHREAGMFPVDELCQIHGCRLMASFTESRGRKATRCKAHAEAGMVDHNKPCEKQGCSRRAVFGHWDEVKSSCTKHRTNSMV